MSVISDYQDKWWSNLQQVVESLDKGYLKPKATFKTNSQEAEIVGSFLKQWSIYLHSVPSFVVWMLGIPGWITKQLYGLSSGIENVFSKVFALFGLFDNISDANSVVGQVYQGLQLVGSAVFVAFLIARVLMSLFSTPFKYKEAFNHIILVTAAVAFLPTAMTSMGNVVASGSLSFLGVDQQQSTSTRDLSFAQVEGRTEKSDSLSVQPIQDNVVDLWQLAKNNFDVDKLGRSVGDSGYINRNAAKVSLNRISDDNVHDIDFADNYGANNKELLDYFKDKAKDNNFYTGLPLIFHSVLKSYEYDDNGKPSLVEVTGYKYHSILKAGNVLIPVYPRYHVEWITLWVEQIMLILLLIGLLFNTIKSIFGVLLSAMVAPIVGYTSVEDSSKFLDLLRQIFAGLAGIFFEVIIVKYAMWFLSSAPTASTTAVSSFTGGSSPFETSIAYIALYVATFVAATMGSRAIENWLGVSTGARAGLATAVGAGFVASKLGSGAVNGIAGRRMANGQRRGGLIRNTAGMARGVKNFGGKAATAGAKGAQAAFKGTQAAFNGATRAAGAVGGFGTAAKENGMVSAMSNVAGNVANKTVAQPLNAAGGAIKSGASRIKAGAENMATTAYSNYGQGHKAGFKGSTQNTLTGGVDYEGQHYPNAVTSNGSSGSGIDPRPDHVVGGGQSSVSQGQPRAQEFVSKQNPASSLQMKQPLKSMDTPPQSVPQKSSPRMSTPVATPAPKPTLKQSPQPQAEPSVQEVKTNKLDRIGKDTPSGEL